jgi:hypothetical protein
MPNTFISASIATGLTIEAGHVTQSADAFTGTEAYDITISGSLTNTGSLDVSGSVGISGNTTIGGTLTAANATINNAVLSGSTDITGSIVVTGSLTVSGSGTFNNIGPFNQTGDSGFIGTHRMSSSASPSIVSVLTENDSFPFIQSSPTTGPNFRMDLADANSSGSAHISLGRQDGFFGGTGFLARYATGSLASQGEIIMALGKNGQLGAQEDRFIVQSEPGRIITNGNSELTLSVGGPTTGRRQVLGNVQDGTGEFANFAAGIDNQFGRKRFVSFEYSSNSTSSQAGFFSSSLAGTGVPNFNTNAIPFGIVAGGSQTTDLTNTVFFIDRGGSVGATVPVTASFQISRGGSINMEGHITSSGNISASGNIIGNNGSFTTSITTPEISGNTEITGDLQVVKITADGRISTTSHITASGNISSSGDITGNTGSFQHIDLPNGAAIKSLPGGNVEIISEDGAFLQITDSFIFNNNGATFAVNAQGDVSDIRHITASGNISASGDIIGLSGSFANLSVSSLAAIGDAISDTINIKGNTTFTLQEGDGGIFRIREEAIDFPILDIKVDSTPGVIFAFDPHLYDNDGGGQGRMGIGVPTASIDAKLHLRQLSDSGEPNNLFKIEKGTVGTGYTTSFRIAKEGNIFASGSMEVQGGKPITTHTSHFSASLANAGHYLIVSGDLTCSISASAAPIGAEFEFFQSSSAGQFLFESASGTTVISKNGSLRLAQQGSSAVLKKVSTTTFHLMGDLT